MAMGKKQKRNKEKVVILRGKDIDLGGKLTELTANEFRVFVLLCRKHNGFNNGDIKLSHNDVKHNCELHSKSTYKRAIDGLLDKEFIVKTKQGGMFRRSSRYLLTDKVKVF